MQKKKDLVKEYTMLVTSHTSCLVYNWQLLGWDENKSYKKLKQKAQEYFENYHVIKQVKCVKTDEILIKDQKFGLMVENECRHLVIIGPINIEAYM